MKQLLLIRHAKAVHTGFSSDKERLLTPRGKADVVLMAKWLKEKNIVVDAFLSSTAQRAVQTARLFIKELKQNIPLQLYNELYMPSVTDYYKIIQQASDNWQTIALVAHNPSLTEFANELTSVQTDHLPTCSIFAVQTNEKHWQHFKNAEKNFWFFDYPKNI